MTDEKKIAQNLDDEQLKDVAGGGNTFGKIAAAYVGIGIPSSIIYLIIALDERKKFKNKKPSADDVLNSFDNILNGNTAIDATYYDALAEWTNGKTREEALTEIQKVLDNMD